MRECMMRCTAGFGNRLMHFIDMRFLQQRFPDAKFHVEWVRNRHCMPHFRMLLSDDEIQATCELKPREQHNFQYNAPLVQWATSGTKFDSLDAWARYDNIVSMYYRTYSFVDDAFAQQYMRKLRFHADIEARASELAGELGISPGATLSAHFRVGDRVHPSLHSDVLMRVERSLLDMSRLASEQCKSLMVFSDDPQVHQLLQRLAIANAFTRPAHELPTGRNNTLMRTDSCMIESIVDMALMMRYTTMIMYCPMSTYSQLVAWGSPVMPPHAFDIGPDEIN